MSLRTRKLVAIFMLLWMPLFASSALAATIPMQMHHACHEMAVPAMQHQDMDMCQHNAPAHSHAASCGNCSVCHVACGGYLATQPSELGILERSGTEVVSLAVSFTSFIPAPLDPPPLVRS
jgi:hypothetical protein